MWHNRFCRGRSAGGLMAATLLAAAALPMAAGQQIDGGEVNISGATLFADFFKSPASTNDAMDVDGDGTFGFDPNRPPFVDQLAPQWLCQGWRGWWIVQDRGVGSVNGLKEFINFQLEGTIPDSLPSEQGLINRLLFAELGQPRQTGCAACNPSNTPYCPSSIDLAVLDVPTSWGVVAGDPDNGFWNRPPASDGYGYNPILSNTGYRSTLQSLTRGQRSLNTNTGNPDRDTVFDTPIAWVPITYISNRGTGVQRLRMTQIQHLLISGRLPSGENLVSVTRSVGSGTRNGIMNTSGIDPAWGRGDNLGNEYANGNLSLLGPLHQPTNCEGSSLVEIVTQNRQLAIGYTGLAGGSRAAADAAAGRYEIIDVMFDDRGGNQYVRPTIASVLDNCDPSTGFQLGGPETFSSRGDPLDIDPGSPTYMANQAAADYLRNILFSIATFSGNPPGEESFNMPGELLALTYFLLDGIDCLPNPTNPTNFQPSQSLNQTLQDFSRDNNGLGIGGDTPPFGSVNIAGLVPRRIANPDFDGDGTPDGYSDGSMDGSFTDAGGNNVLQGLKLSERNQTSGDFNNDNLRNWNDIARLLTAVRSPRTFEQGVDHGGNRGQMVGDFVIPEVIGDFTGEGNLDAFDVRYFADGLALNPATGRLDRKQGFTRVDLEWFNQQGDVNYFDTVLATGAAYSPGDSRGDVAGSTAGPAPGGPPLGADGAVNADDIDYVCANFGDFTDLDTSPLIDLSCDMNGDLKIDPTDIDEIVMTILDTLYGDVNLDGTVDQADLDIVNAHLNTPGGWADGDMNCDGFVDEADRQIVIRNMGGCDPCDANCDGNVNAFDIEPFIDVLFNGVPPCGPCACDINGDGQRNAFDIEPFIACLFGP